MKSVIIFLPSKLAQWPGCMYGKVAHEVGDNRSTFYILGLTESMSKISNAGNELSLLGYFYGTEKKKEYWERKLPNWVEIYVANKNIIDQNNKSGFESYDYCVRNISVKNQKCIVATCHIVIILYDENALLKAELCIDNGPVDNFFELRAMLNREFVRKNQEKLKVISLAKLKDFIFIIITVILLFVTNWLCSLTSFLKPVLKYSSLGIHLSAWFQNARWTLSSLQKYKRFTLKTTTYIIAMILDMLLGLLVLKVLLHYLGDSKPSEVYLYHAEKVVESLKGLVNWLMGSPAGLKLNPPFNGILGKFFLYHIHLWWVFLMVTKPLMEVAFGILLFFGRLGVTFQISILADLLALVSFHTYCIYVYAARLFNIQIRGLTALFRLFLGKKQNPLRRRVDSCRYQPDQLFVGTLLFTILLFLMPTTWVYYIVFTILRLILIGLDGLLTKLKFYLQFFPIYTFIRWVFHAVDARGSVGIILKDRHIKGPVTVLMKTTISPWSATWEKSLPENISIYPPIEWSKIAKNVFWGQLLYPF